MDSNPVPTNEKREHARTHWSRPKQRPALRHTTPPQHYTPYSQTIDFITLSLSLTNDVTPRA